MSDNSDIRCPDKVRLGHLVVEAIQEVFRVRNERKASDDKAKRKKLFNSARAARQKLREAAYALRAHVESHGC
jgi:hypothetical protein